MTAIEYVLIGVVVVIVLVVFFVLIGGLASWAVAPRTVTRIIAEEAPRTQLCGCPYGQVLPTCPGAGEETAFEADADQAVDIATDTAAHLLLWEAELGESAAIQRHLRRMDRWS